MVIVSADRRRPEHDALLLVDDKLEVPEFDLALLEGLDDTAVLIRQDQFRHSYFTSQSCYPVNYPVTGFVFDDLEIDALCYRTREEEHIDLSVQDLFVSESH